MDTFTIGRRNELLAQMTYRILLREDLESLIERRVLSDEIGLLSSALIRDVIGIFDCSGLGIEGGQHVTIAPRLE